MQTETPNYGQQDHRVKFLRYLKDEERFTIPELAEKSMHSQDTVKAWLSASPMRKRDVTARAIAMLLQNLGRSYEEYKEIAARR